ncbi:RNase P modulator RnpM [Succinispira mobilis]|uniref:RNase P modulator RnpM n=1 Tax=Succinispira mobilis TaxID=78120 RepID=UPI0003816EBC|nr:YlxR family protein [Succinispira mobilis]
MKPKKIPQRMCIACQEMKNKKELIRVVRIPTAEVQVDLSGKKSGRGAYVCLNKLCIEKARKEKRLERVLKEEVPAEIYTQLLELTEVEDAKN